MAESATPEQVTPETTSSAETSAAVVPSPAQQSTSQASTQATTPATSGQDDAKYKGVLADLQKERKARQAFERQQTELNTRLAERERQIQALTGAKASTPEDAEIQAVKERFAQLFPGLAKLSDDQIERLIQLSERSTNLEETTQHYWTNHGRSMLESIGSEVAKELGGEQLNDRQKKALYSAFIQAAENDEAFLNRYEKGDPTLAKEFAKNWVEDWFEPARRKVTQTTVNRVIGRVVPKSGPAQTVVTKPATKAKDLDEITDRAVAYLRDNGQMGS